MFKNILITLSFLFFVGCAPSNNVQPQDSVMNSSQMEKLTHTILLVERDYVEDIRFNKIVDRTIKGFFENLDENSKKFDKNFSSFGSKKIDENILYLKLPSLNSINIENMKKEIVSNINSKGMILDLRNNDGESFKEAIKVIDLFIDEGVIALLEAKNKRKEFLAKKENTIYKGELYLLTNSKTSSSAELISGTLKEYNRAVIIGEKTVGNDTAIEIFSFSNKSNEMYSLNVGKLYLPSGKSIKDKVLPNIKIKNREAKLKEAIKLLKKSN